MSKAAYLAAICVLANSLLAVSGRAQHFPPSEDTFVSSGRPTANFGSGAILVVSLGTTTYMKFDLPGVPAGSSVAKATLRLYVDGVVTGGGFDVYNLPATPGWSENTLKYSTPPPARSVSATGGHPIVVSVSSLNKFLSIDMTAAVQGWLRNPSSNNGVALAVTGNTGLFSFDSKESLLPSHVPELEIVLEDPVDAGDEPRMIHIKAHCTNGLACASGACPTTHSDGLGQDYYNCLPLDTYTQTTAIEAGTAYEISIGGSSANVSGGWFCSNNSLVFVCATNPSGDPLSCWGYEGSETGQVSGPNCPWVESGTWN